MHAAKIAQTAAPTWQPDGASFALFQSSAEVDSYYKTYHMSRKRPNPGLRTAVDAAVSFPAATGAAGASADGDYIYIHTYNRYLKIYIILPIAL